MYKKVFLYSILGILGAVVGYAYWFYVGCNSGHCLISSVWYNSTIYGSVLGFLVAGIVKDYLKL
jgi:hypothetical protein